MFRNDILNISSDESTRCCAGWLFYNVVRNSLTCRRKWSRLAESIKTAETGVKNDTEPCRWWLPVWSDRSWSRRQRSGSRSPAWKYNYFYISWMQINVRTSVWWACSVASSPRIPVVEPGLVFEVKLFQILQRNALLLLPAPVEQTLHTALRNTQRRRARRHRLNTYFL